MVHFVLAGKPDCKHYVQALSIVHYLKRSLPAFDFTAHEYVDEEWDTWLLKTNREHKWHHGSSPLIYKELYYYGSKKPILIGGIAEFFEYCYDYYGLECLLTDAEIEALVKTNAKSHRTKTTQVITKLNVMIYGATLKMTGVLMPEIMKMEGCGSTSNIQFILYDDQVEAGYTEFFQEFNEEFQDMFSTTPTYCDNLGDGLKDCQVLIILEDTPELEKTGNNEAMQNYLVRMFFLAEEINLCGNRDLKIIFANSGMTSFVATVLAQKVRISNTQIVVVSSDLGLGYLGEMSRRLNIDTENMCAPPVWGSLGLNEFVDAGSTLVKSKVYKPYQRAVQITQDSTLIHGTIHLELRFINYLSDDLHDLNETVDRRRKIVMGQLQRAPIFARVEAVLNLLKIWLGCSTLHEPIISLGIMSDGSFNIPPNIVFSQPAIKFRDGWIPYTNYPVPEHVLDAVAIAGMEAESHYLKYSTGAFFRKAKSIAPGNLGLMDDDIDDNDGFNFDIASENDLSLNSVKINLSGFQLRSFN